MYVTGKLNCAWRYPPSVSWDTWSLQCNWWGLVLAECVLWSLQCSWWAMELLPPTMSKCNKVPVLLQMELPQFVQRRQRVFLQTLWMAVGIGMKVWSMLVTVDKGWLTFILFLSSTSSVRTLNPSSPSTRVSSLPGDDIVNMTITEVTWPSHESPDYHKRSHEVTRLFRSSTALPCRNNALSEGILPNCRGTRLPMPL